MGSPDDGKRRSEGSARDLVGSETKSPALPGVRGVLILTWLFAPTIVIVFRPALAVSAHWGPIDVARVTLGSPPFWSPHLGEEFSGAHSQPAAPTGHWRSSARRPASPAVVAAFALVAPLSAAATPDPHPARNSLAESSGSPLHACRRFAARVSVRPRGSRGRRWAQCRTSPRGAPPPRRSSSRQADVGPRRTRVARPRDCRDSRPHRRSSSSTSLHPRARTVVARS